MKNLMLALSLLALVACGGSGDSKTEAPKDADHAAMDHSKMDHSKMDHSKMHQDEKPAAEALKYRCADAPDKVLDRPQKCADGTLAAAVFPEGKTGEYFCPMHKDVVQAEPGKCGECGMFLSARVKDDGAAPVVHEGMDKMKEAPAAN